jgi:murein DD-endopeptidase MepM/ murein hydrolase activator NlpD
MSSPIALPSAISLSSSHRDDEAKVRELAHEFEGMLLLQMLREMRQTTHIGGGEEESAGFQAGDDTMSDTMDAELARQLSLAGGVGLADVIVEAFKAHQLIEPQETVNTGARAALHTSAPLARESTTVVPPTPDRRVSVKGTAGLAGSSTAVSSTGQPAAGAPTIPADSESDGPSAVPLPTDARLTSHFGWRHDPFTGQARFHGGVDVRAAYGSDVPTAAAGRVVSTGTQGGYGLTVVVEHAPGLRTRYAHLSASLVRVGDEVTAGQPIGRAGRSGRATGPHLHFEVIQDGQRIDPELAAARFAALDEFKPQRLAADSSSGGKSPAATEE